MCTKPLTAGVQGTGRICIRVLDAAALACYLSLVLKYSDTKRDTKRKNIVDLNWGGGGVAPGSAGH